MNEIARSEGVPEYPVLGENLHSGLLVAITVVGVLMAAAATWLAQGDTQTNPTSTISQTLVTSETVKSHLNDSPVPSTEIPNTPATVTAMPANETPSSNNAKPTCPEIVSLFFPVGATVPQNISDTSELDLIVNWAKSNPETKIAVHGYADMVGLDQTNLLLSYERAKTVSSLLASRGVLLQRIQIAAAGSHSLVEGSPGDAQVNRRVTVQISNPEGCKTASK
jgi:outer membrane protein OmpA-like peptidoglycan-associated protein